MNSSKNYKEKMNFDTNVAFLIVIHNFGFFYFYSEAPVISIILKEVKKPLLEV